MSTVWRPDDSLLQRDENGQLNGVKRVRDALIKGGIVRVVTSRDEGMQAVQADLARTGGPPDVEQWQLPIVLKSDQEVLWFISHLQPGAKVPRHSHEQGHLRLVMQGSLRYGDVVLDRPGDWMYVPGGVEYELQAGDQGCWVCYPHPFPCF